jgi:hypothetical protein
VSLFNDCYWQTIIKHYIMITVMDFS